MIYHARQVCGILIIQFHEALCADFSIYRTRFASAIMLPETLMGSYKRYKEDTKSFVTWLHNKAISCGYKAPTSRCVTVEYEDESGHAPPIFAKDEYKTGPRTLSTNELISQAHAVAELRSQD